jgi:hypothetical protein
MMGVKCYCCGHPERDVIDAALVAGQSMRSLSKKYGCSVNSVMRHRDHHLSPALAAMAAKREEEAASGLVAQVRQLVRRADELYTAAAKDGRSSAALAALKEMRGSLELLGKATGELKDASPVTVVNLQTAPEWLAVRAAILAALTPYPQARAAVTGNLLQLEAHNP